VSREKLDEAMAALAPLFARVEPRRDSRAYAERPLSDTPVKPLAVGRARRPSDSGSDESGRWSGARWDAFAAMHAVRKFTVEHRASGR